MAEAPAGGAALGSVGTALRHGPDVGRITEEGILFNRQAPRDRIRTVAEVILYANVALLLTWDYLQRLRAFDGANGRWQLHAEVVAGEAVDPYRYRILVPNSLEVLVRLGLVPEGGVGLDRIYGAYFVAALFAIILLTRMLLDRFGFDRGHAMAGALLVGALLSVALRDHGFQPWSWLEAVTVVLAMILATENAHPAWFAVLVLVATLNRETAIFLPAIAVAAAVAYRGDRGRRTRWLVAAALGYAAWGAARAFTYWLVGTADQRAITVEGIFGMNTAPGAQRRAAEVLLLLLGGVLLCAVLAAFARRTTPFMFWAPLLVIPQYMAAWAVYAVWYEVRVLVPVLVLALPAAMAAILRPSPAVSGAVTPEDDDREEPVTVAPTDRTTGPRPVSDRRIA